MPVFFCVYVPRYFCFYLVGGESAVRSGRFIQVCLEVFCGSVSGKLGFVSVYCRTGFVLFDLYYWFALDSSCLI